MRLAIDKWNLAPLDVTAQAPRVRASSSLRAGTNSTRKPVVNTFLRAVCICLTDEWRPQHLCPCRAPVPVAVSEDSFVNADDHDDKRLLHYASLHPSMVHIEIPNIIQSEEWVLPDLMTPLLDLCLSLVTCDL